MRRLVAYGAVGAALFSGIGVGEPTLAGATPGQSVQTPFLANSYVGLSQGATGDNVKAVQRALMSAGIPVPGGADGQFGPATRQAVINFQSAKGLSQTGSIDAATAAALGLSSESTSSTVNILQQGATGDAVKEVQQKLIAAGVYVAGGADGVYGPATARAVRQYQQWNGLTASGTVDAATATKLGLSGSSASSSSGSSTTTTAATSSTNPYVGLAVGARGDKVKELQRALMDTGLVVRGGADGVFGNATKSALQAFQSVNGISQTGVLTEKGAGILNLGETTSGSDSGSTSTTSSSTSGLVTPDGYPKIRESSERVRLMQQALIDAGITVVGGADGSFGNATKAAIESFQRNRGLTVSGIITQATADALGLSSSESNPAPSSGGIQLDRFPIQGRCYFGNTWHAPRSNGRVHEGVDIIASEGNLLYAVVDGTISKQYWDYPGALSGNGVRVAQDDGTYFTYLHMLDFAPGIEVGTKVKAGDVIGFVGNTGSSATPHLHFEIHPGGGAAVNPYPYVKAIDDCSNTTAQYQSSFEPS